MLAEGLVGYTFSCPDMIGGGDFVSFLDLNKWTRTSRAISEIHALMPMMQFSLHLWRVLDAEHLAAVEEGVAIREKFAPMILDLARNSGKTGEPIVRLLEYVFPHQDLPDVKDEFMLGDGILIAPLDQKGNSRQVVLPKESG